MASVQDQVDDYVDKNLEEILDEEKPRVIDWLRGLGYIVRKATVIDEDET